MPNWTLLGKELRQSAMDAHDGSLPDVNLAYSFLLDNLECFFGDGNSEWPEDMPSQPNIELILAYYHLEDSKMPDAPINNPSLVWLGGGIMLALFVILATGADLAIAAWQRRRDR